MKKKSVLTSLIVFVLCLFIILSGILTHKVQATTDCTVTFDCGLGGFAYTEVTVASGSKVAKPEDPEFFSCRFLKWVTELDGDEEFNFNTPITENTTVFAKWDVSASYFYDWFFKMPKFVINVFSKNNINTLEDFNNYLYPEEQNETLDWLNMAWFVDFTQVVYSLLNVEDDDASSNNPFSQISLYTASAETFKSSADICKGFLRSQIIFDDLAKLIENIQTKNFMASFTCILEIHPDFVEGVKKLAEEEPEPEPVTATGNEGFYATYFNALKKAVEKNDVKLLAPTYFYDNFFATPKSVCVIADNVTKIKDASDPTLTYRVVGLEAGEELEDIVITREEGESVGKYKITVSQKDGANSDYFVTFVDGTFEIISTQSNSNSTSNNNNTFALVLFGIFVTIVLIFVCSFSFKRKY